MATEEPQPTECHPCSEEEARLLKAMMQMYSVMERGLQQLSHAAITLEIHMLDGTSFEVQVCATGTVADLCDAIEAEKGFPPYMQELMLEDREEPLPVPKIGLKDPNKPAHGFGFGSRTDDFEEKLLMSYGIRHRTALVLSVTSAIGAIQKALGSYTESFYAHIAGL